MSLLAPLYFAGALAISLPILFHLIRRTPKGQVEFSSLMFLQPTPPRLTRRSRLDNWPLLLLRAAALMLLAAAFARPFLRSVALSGEQLPPRRLVLLVDTSASMQRATLWQQALDQARDVLADMRPADQLAVVTFDQRPKTLLGFEQSSRIPPQQRQRMAEDLLRQSAPTWHRTELGRAISYAGDLAVTYESRQPADVELDAESTSSPSTSRSSAATGPAQLILISDMQAGSHRESLQVYAWPKQLRLDVRKVVPQGSTNASAVILDPSTDSQMEADRVRVRVTNSADASDSRFELQWSTGNEPSSLLPVQVPPGESRVLRMPAPGPGVTSLVLQGDDHSFDNTRYLVPPQTESLTLLHVGDPRRQKRESLLYYLARVPLGNLHRTVTIQSQRGSELVEVPEPRQVPLVVLASAVSSEVAGRLRDYVRSGGRLLVVLADQTGSQQLGSSVSAITGGQLGVGEARVDDYVMLSRIDFGHPLFHSMADPQFNDFTKIRFWSHRTVTGLGDRWNILARFDDGDPALAQCELGKGRVFLLAAGWQPSASQLALSTKFIPMVFSLFDSSRRQSPRDRYTLGQPIDVAPSPDASITTPAGIFATFEANEDIEVVSEPGVYEFRDAESARQFAVNLDESESRTEAIGDDELERFGVVLGKSLTIDQALANERQLRDRELESRQKLWQWLLVAVLVLLGLETLLAARWSRRSSADIQLRTMQ